MKQRRLAKFSLALVLSLFSTTALAAGDPDEDTDTRMVEVEVVEITDARISVIARTGVEHVIAIDGSGTKVKLDGRSVSLKDLRVGDIVTVELDAESPVKLARNIEMRSDNRQVARARPK
ncbi:MAG: hypothetical protein ACRD68_13665 [Pyrinomonadaceae bacterium]